MTWIQDCVNNNRLRMMYYNNMVVDIIINKKIVS